jgi:hypothetical protein
MPRLTVPKDVAFTEVGGEAVLVNCQSGVYFGLDAVGTQMWEALTRSGDVEGAVAELKAVFEVEPDRLRDDVLRFVQQLVSHGLLVETGAETR